MAISSPLLETSIDGAHGVLINIVGSTDIGLEEVEQAASLVQAAVHPDANTIFGAAFDETLDDEISVTVIATGFEDQKTSKPKTVSEMQHAEHFAGVAMGANAAAEPVPVPDGPVAPVAPVAPAVPVAPAPAVQAAPVPTPTAPVVQTPAAPGDLLDDFKTIFSPGAPAAPAAPASAQPVPAAPAQPAPSPAQPAEPEEKDPFEDIFKIFNR